MSKYGVFLFGLGVMFHGNELLGESVVPLRDYQVEFRGWLARLARLAMFCPRSLRAQPFLDFLANVQHPLVGTLVACLFTMLVQASAATISIAQVLAQQGLVSLRTGICIVLGANVGTVSTGLVAAIGTNRATVRVGVCCLLIKVCERTALDCRRSLGAPVDSRRSDTAVSDAVRGAGASSVRCVGRRESLDRQRAHAVERDCLALFVAADRRNWARHADAGARFQEMKLFCSCYWVRNKWNKLFRTLATSV